MFGANGRILDRNEPLASFKVFADSADHSGMDDLSALSRDDRIELVVTAVMMQLTSSAQWDRMQEIMDQAIYNYAVGDEDELHNILATRMVPPAPRSR